MPVLGAPGAEFATAPWGRQDMYIYRERERERYRSIYRSIDRPARPSCCQAPKEHTYGVYLTFAAIASDRAPLHWLIAVAETTATEHRTQDTIVCARASIGIGEARLPSGHHHDHHRHVRRWAKLVRRAACYITSLHLDNATITRKPGGVCNAKAVYAM